MKTKEMKMVSKLILLTIKTMRKTSRRMMNNIIKRKTKIWATVTQLPTQQT